MDAWETLLELLDRKALTAVEAEDALVTRGCGRMKARSAVAKARHLGLLDDRRVAEDIVERSGAPSGLLRVRYDLERRGVDERVAEEAIAAVDDLERCKAALSAYLGRHGRPGDLRGVARIVGYLARRGFTEESVRQSLAEQGIDPGWQDA